MMRLAAPGDVPRLKEIWALCFGDSAAYIDFYFAHRFIPEQVMVYEEDEISAMLSMLPLTLRTANGTVPAIYIYAVATHPDYQKHGIGGRLLMHTHDYLQRQDVALSVLVPSSDKLFSYYSRCAFDQQLDIIERQYFVADIPIVAAGVSGKLVPLSLPDFILQRQKFLSSQDSCFDWNEAALDYQFRVSCMTGGVFQLNLADCSSAHPYRSGYVVVEKDSRTIYIKETSFAASQVSAAAAYVLREFGGTSCFVRAPATEPSPFARPFAMASLYKEAVDLSGTYFGLVLD